MRSMKPKDPRWKLDTEWAVDTDDYNWVLYHRATKKDGTPGLWNAKGFYPSDVQLFESLYRKLTRTEPKNLDLCSHVEYISRRVQASSTRLSEQLSADIWSGLKRPARGRAA
jgi:hypothetical protein